MFECQLENTWLSGVGYPRRRRDAPLKHRRAGKEKALEKGRRIVHYSAGRSRRGGCECTVCVWGRGVNSEA